MSSSTLPSGAGDRPRRRREWARRRAGPPGRSGGRRGRTAARRPPRPRSARATRPAARRAATARTETRTGRPRRARSPGGGVGASGSPVPPAILKHSEQQPTSLRPQRRPSAPRPRSAPSACRSRRADPPRARGARSARGSGSASRSRRGRGPTRPPTARRYSGRCGIRMRPPGLGLPFRVAGHDGSDDHPRRRGDQRPVEHGAGEPVAHQPYADRIDALARRASSSVRRGCPAVRAVASHARLADSPGDGIRSGAREEGVGPRHTHGSAPRLRRGRNAEAFRSVAAGATGDLGIDRRGVHQRRGWQGRGDRGRHGPAGGPIWVLLPDTASSDRWEGDDLPLFTRRSRTPAS